MSELCGTCKTGANFVEDEPVCCPFVDRLKDGKCGCYAKLEPIEMNYDMFKSILQKIEYEKPTLHQMVGYLMDNNFLMTPFELISIQQKLAKYDADMQRILGINSEEAIL